MLKIEDFYEEEDFGEMEKDYSIFFNSREFKLVEKFRDFYLGDRDLFWAMLEGREVRKELIVAAGELFYVFKRPSLKFDSGNCLFLDKVADVGPYIFKFYVEDLSYYNILLKEGDIYMYNLETLKQVDVEIYFKNTSFIRLILSKVKIFKFVRDILFMLK